MSLSQTTTAEIYANIIAQLESTLNQSIPLLPKSFLRVLAKALAGVFVLIYKYAGWMFLQIFVETASDAETEVNGTTVVPLTLWGRLIGVGDPGAATQAEMTIDITVENQTGSLASGTQLLNASNGVTYLTIGSTALDAAVVSATIRASGDQTNTSGAGSQGNLSDGDEVTFANPIANVARTASVTGTTVTGADAEATSAYRQRVLDRFQKRAQGGATSDYEQWGEDPSGILNIYPYTSASPGQVNVYAEATAASSGSEDGIPTDAQLGEVLDAINYDDDGLASRRPIGSYVNVYPITRLGFTVTISSLVVSDEADVKESITSAVEEYFTDRAPYIVGLTALPRKDIISRSGVGGVVDDIVSAAGGYFGSVIVTPDAGTSSIEIYALGEGEKAKASAVEYV